jgi:uncharacterized membrane protein
VNQVLLILHLFGFGGGVGASLGNFIIGGLIAASPNDAPTFNRMRLVLARLGQMALGLLWLTGIILIWSKWGGPAYVPQLFWLKLLLVLVLTALTVVMDLTVKAVRAGNTALASRLPTLGIAGAVLLILIVVIAVFAFD